MATFDSSGRPLSVNGSPDAAVLVEHTGARAAPALVKDMAGMVDALKQFDANGQALHGLKVTAASALTTLETKPRRPDVDILANGK